MLVVNIELEKELIWNKKLNTELQKQLNINHLFNIGKEIQLSFERENIDGRGKIDWQYKKNT